MRAFGIFLGATLLSLALAGDAGKGHGKFRGLAEAHRLTDAHTAEV